ncbi:MAG TPA: M20/M25/M40 family metallo-hydrolase [Longimicrobiales bacterium]|nr:M20/M25/M40 family metallo-hydrolase [Longimicrobiales bacterium]
MRPPISPRQILVLLVATAACAEPRIQEPPRTPVPDTGAPTAAAATITAEDMRARIGFLASDALRGRDTPSPELEVAAAYVASEFMRLGLEPAGEGGGYMQRYPFPLRALDAGAAAATLVGPAGARTLTLGADMAVEAGRVGADSAGMVYVGERLPADVGAGVFRHRVVLVDLPGAPPAEGARVSRDWRQARSAALRAARGAEAAAVMFVLEPTWRPEHVAMLQRGYARPERSMGDPLAAYYVRHDVARALLRDAGLDPEARPAAPVPLPSLTAVLSAPSAVLEATSAPNVAALLRGSDPALRDSYVIFSAHMDHVGVGRPDASGDSIYNGADDNASGTAAILEIAEAFAALPSPPARSVVFLMVSGEEKGLLGSAWYADHPTVPLERIVANVNIDMIGRNAPDSIVVIGQDYSSLGPLVQAVNAARPELGLTVSQDLWPEERFFFRSDHFNFARKEIPALFFFSGVHEDYHRPSDHVEKIDADKAARVARLIFHTAHAMAMDPAAPAWTPEGLAEVRRLTR